MYVHCASECVYVCVRDQRRLWVCLYVCCVSECVYVSMMREECGCVCMCVCCVSECVCVCVRDERRVWVRVYVPVRITQPCSQSRIKGKGWAMASMCV